MHCSLFCRVIDNYGDIGVCWRLARQLVHEHGWHVTLWVDDLASFARIAPALDVAQAQQRLDGIEVRHWADPLPADAAVGDIVIEAFACELPHSYQQAMAAQARRPLWLNLEYLSAEDWVEGCHGLPSPHPRLPLQKYFFFPGFTPRTGGLLCEQALLAARDAWQADSAAQHAYWQACGVPPCPPGGVRYSLFAYDSPAAAQWVQQLAAGSQPVQLLLPMGKVVPDVLQALGLPPDAAAGQHYACGQLALYLLPMTDQAGYDRLLWSCDFNMVRGEDSFLRAQWAGRPFAWHIYRQDDDAHIDKLQAFLQHYCHAMPPALGAAVQGFMLAWNRNRLAADSWPALLQHWPQWQLHAQAWPDKILAGGSLAARLVQFSQIRLQ
jgi:uncharacterized repeat protein (TIGR03837 family)